MKLLSDIDVSGKRVFVRADLDVSLKDKGLRIKDELFVRLQSLKPTVDWLLKHGARQVIIAGHIGRPKKPDLALSTKLLVEPLEKILGQKITFESQSVSQLIGDTPGVSMAATLHTPGVSKEITLLENLRFWPGEVENDQGFAKKLASMADIYINEAFGVCHRENASVVALPLLFADVEDPEGFHPRRAAGLHLEEEVSQLNKVIKNPERPFVAIIGGAKIETKVPVIENLAKIADFVLVGGAIAREFQISNFKFQISNVVVATSEANDKDIDQESIGKFKQIISTAKSVVWNGPMGVFEEGFEKGTMAIARAILDSGAYSIVGGGETTEFLSSKELISLPAGGFSFVSVGGGAMLEFLAGKKLPGLKALQ